MDKEILNYMKELTQENSVDLYILDDKVSFYYPSKKLAIDFASSLDYARFGGNNLHSKLFRKEKFLQARKQGIHLITIFDVDWETNQHKIKMYLNSLFCKNKVIYARKCVVKHIDKLVANSFVDKYHIQGHTRVQSIHYGLYYNNELVSVMCIGKLRMEKTECGQFELHRYCVKDGYTVVGGANKLLKEFEREYKPKYIRSYSDNDYFVGGIYTRLGFKEIEQSFPRYYWYVNGVEVRRERCQLKHLKIKYPKLLQEAYDVEASNKEIYVMYNKLGNAQVYRSGNTKWEKYYRKRRKTPSFSYGDIRRVL